MLHRAETNSQLVKQGYLSLSSTTVPSKIKNKASTNKLQIIFNDNCETHVILKELKPKKQKKNYARIKQRDRSNLWAKDTSNDINVTESVRDITERG
jgi:hypothetical protein